jgi:hypothetical protein
MKMEFLYRYRTLGGHVHVEHYVGVEGYTRALAGTTVYREHEWAAFRAIHGGDAGDDVLHRTGTRVMFVNEDKEMDE